MGGEGQMPEWVIGFIELWKSRLFLGEWQLRISADHAPDGDGTGATKATVELWPDVREAAIVLQDTVPEEPDRDWQHNILHELVHVRLAGVSEPVLQDLLPELAPAARTVAARWFRHELEEAVDLLACAFLLWSEEDGLKETSDDDDV